MCLGQNVGDAGRCDSSALGIEYGAPRGKVPTAVCILDAVVKDDSAAVNTGNEIRRLGPVAQWGGSRLRRPRLLQSPASAHGQQVVERCTGDGLAIARADRIARGKGPVAAHEILDIDAPIQQHSLPLGITAETHGRELAGRLHCLAPGAEDVADLLDEQLQLRNCHGFDAAGDELRELHVVGHGDGQVGDRAKTLTVNGEICEPGRPAAFSGIAGVDVASGQQRLEHARGGAVGETDRRTPDELDPLWRYRRQRIFGQRDRGNAELVERLEFAAVGDTVAILVLPDAQGRPDRVGVIDGQVKVGVVARQVCVTTTEAGAKHFRDVIDLAVAVAVQHQKSIVALEPTAVLGEQVVVEVEIDLAIVLCNRLDAITIEINNQWVGIKGPADRFCGAHLRCNHHKQRVEGDDQIGHNHGRR